tara:strand:+ start:177 stop:314 length:138 start_codon:yes stop_codon:yes gene_type:complete
MDWFYILMLKHLLYDLFLRDCGLIHAVQSIVKRLTSALKRSYVTG